VELEEVRLDPRGWFEDEDRPRRGGRRDTEPIVLRELAELVHVLELSADPDLRVDGEGDSIRAVEASKARRRIGLEDGGALLGDPERDELERGLASARPVRRGGLRLGGEGAVAPRALVDVT